MAGIKVSEITTEVINTDGDELLYLVDDPNGTPGTAFITVSNLANNLVPGSPISVEDDGTPLTTDVTKFNFSGAGVTTTEPVANEILINIPGATGSAVTVVDEVTTLTTDVSKLTFTGAGVTATEPVANEVTITIPGGSVTPASTVVEETSFGGSSSVGTDSEYARQDHSHGTPANPVTGHVGIYNHDNYESHLNNTANPHSVTYTQVGADAAGSASGAISTHEITYSHGGYDSHVGDTTTNPHSVTAAQTGADAAGTASGLISTHETTHPIPTNRDTRNQVAGSYEVGGAVSTHESTYNHTNYNTAYTHSTLTTGNPHSVTAAQVGADPTGTASGLMSTHETTHPAPTSRDTRNQVAGSYEVGGAVSTHESTYNHANYNTAYTHSTITTGNPHSVTAAEAGADASGTASGLMSTHETTHPIPTNRDTRNDAAGTASGLMTTHETTHPAPTVRDSRNQVAGSYEVGGAVSTHESSYNHANLHAESHTVASHSDTSATGPELDELTNGSETTLHSHAGGTGSGNVTVSATEPTTPSSGDVWVDIS